MPKYETKFAPGEKVKTPFGTVGIIQAIFIDKNSGQYYVKEENLERYWFEEDLKPAE